MATLRKQNKWPCVFGSSDTTGAKEAEEFFTDAETLDMQRFEKLGVIKNQPQSEDSQLRWFRQQIQQMKQQRHWDKAGLVKLFQQMLPQFGHKETGKYLDSKM